MPTCLHDGYALIMGEKGAVMGEKGAVKKEKGSDTEQKAPFLVRGQGRTQGGEGPAPPWDLKSTIFSGFLPLNSVICIFEVCFF